METCMFACIYVHACHPQIYNKQGVVYTALIKPTLAGSGHGKS